VHPDGSVVILPKIPTSKIKGIVKARRRVSLNEMDISIGESAIGDLEPVGRSQLHFSF
jgi:CRISPR/Cas system CMR subunit Cmr6 (Cas7 group RAMP superfamily)